MLLDLSRSESQFFEGKLELTDLYIDPAPMQLALAAHPELWNENKSRTAPVGSPHREMDDIWVRFAAPGTVVDPEVPYQSVWWPAAAKLPVELYAAKIMLLMGATEIGNVLITRVPPGKECYPHTDGGWHALNFKKYAVQVQSAPGQRFYVEDQFIEPAPGQVFQFNNQREHWVTNPTQHERITLIVCVKS